MPPTVPPAGAGPPPGGGAPLPSVPIGSPPDPLDLTSSLTFRAADPLGGFVGYDDHGGLVLRARRDGTGLGVVLMNFAIENAVGLPYFYIRHPPAGFTLHPVFALLGPAGASVGDLRFGVNRGTLEVPGQEPLVAALSMVPWRGYAVLQGTAQLATVGYRGHPFDPAGAEIILEFTPLGADPTRRRWVLALVAFVTLVAPEWRHSTTRP